MNTHEKSGNQEWLNDAEVRNMRFGQLGLSENQKYAELSAEEKQFLNMDYYDRRFIDRSLEHYGSNHDIPFNERESIRRDYINDYLKWYNHLSGAFVAPDGKSSKDLTMALTDALFSLDVSAEKLQKINILMAEPDTPYFAKQMATFTILYPDLKASFKGGEMGDEGIPTAYNSADKYICSPVISEAIEEGSTKSEKGRSYKAEDIIYHDILKCAFMSGGKNVEQFLDKLSGGTDMMHAIMCWPGSDESIGNYYSKRDLNVLQTLIRQLHSIHYQTQSGDKENYTASLNSIKKSPNEFRNTSITDMKADIQKIYDEYRPTKRYDLADRVVRSFCHPLGIKNLSEAYEFLDHMQERSYYRHEELIASGKVGQIKNGDFIKSVGDSEYLPYLLESGVLAKEYLGIGAPSDCTPLDTDVAKITNSSQGLRQSIRQSVASAFSGMGDDNGDHRYVSEDADNIFLIFNNDRRFINNTINNDNKPSFEYQRNKYEVFPALEHFVVKNQYVDDDDAFYYDDYGIRTGIPSSEIDYIATDEKSAAKVIEAVRESGLFIPVTDLDGDIIYNPFNHGNRYR